MIAIVEIGGKQYTVEKGQTIDVDNQNLEVGATLETSALLLADAEGKKVQVGTPTVDGSKVTFSVVENFKDEKIRVFKIIPKKRHTRTRGFRAMKTRLQVVSIA
ncbi:MAG: 50S ribosomal protein L21 [Candidatus Gracilibacteria bacterium]|nr:50S ribosomal protein L21 [Candidatus Gracilibacteria bacterium]